MLDIYLSDYGLKDFCKQPQISAYHIARLATTIDSIEGLYLHEYTNIKRLKGIKPTVWRYRSQDFRVIFTTGSRDEPFLIIHRVAERDLVYDNLPKYFPHQLHPDWREIKSVEEFEELIIDDTTDEDITNDRNFQDFARYYNIPKTLFDVDENSDHLIEYIITGEYLKKPCLTSEQENLASQLINNHHLIYQIQGAAGTGKTTIAFHLAAMAVKQSILPIIIVPNEQLKNFGKKLLTAINPDYKIHTNEWKNNFQESNIIEIALFSRDLFWQRLSGSQRPVLTASQGCKIIRDYLLPRTPRRKFNKFKHLNLYAIAQSFLLGETYEFSSRDGLTTNYQEALDFLQTYWQTDTSNIFQKQDAYSQAKKAELLLKINQEWLQAMANQRKTLIIIDEIQDFYWFQLKNILDLTQESIIILGDENQRITFSGFSWSALAATLEKQKSIVPIKPIIFTKNFRNTKQITAAARYIIKDAFKSHIATSKFRHLPNPGEPNDCYEEGKRPYVIKVDQTWLEEMLTQLKEIIANKSQETTNKLVFIYRDLLEIPIWLEQKMKELGEKLLSYTVSEAKGQEFEAAVILFPFKNQQTIAIDDLFDWYTAITRCRTYQTILVEEQELAWLYKNVNDYQQFEQFFQIKTQVNPQEFARELYYEGRSFITLQQLRQKFLDNLSKEILQWLQGDKPPQELTNRWRELKFTWWELAQELTFIVRDLVNTSVIDDIQLKPLNNFPLLEAFVLYSGAKILLDNEQIDTTEMTKEILLRLEKYAISQPDIFTEALNKIEDKDLKVLLLRANFHSWEAAHLLRDYNKHQDIEQVINDLERRGLIYDAIRMKVQLLDKQIDNNIPYFNILGEEGSLVKVLCQSFLKQLGK